MKSDSLDAIFSKARRVPPAPADAAALEAPPGLARGVVHRWLSSSANELSGSWLVISRRGLAVAIGLMAASMLWHARELRAPVLMESTASETVILSLYPQ
jgi:hypothetical protein